ncbi:Scr1 family TA system antitoxin-like transcriptional regulator [Paractinoplanes toevensis]|nr:Scr1 family TA system antitoxin-like transcriptional regulator [Actinoplanes toevensis]
MSELPAVTFRILPYDVGEHPLLGASIAILDFPEPTDSGLVYLEGFGRSRNFLRLANEVARYRDEFELLSRRCLDRRRTTAMIDGVLDRND